MGMQVYDGSTLRRTSAVTLGDSQTLAAATAGDGGLLTNLVAVAIVPQSGAACYYKHGGAASSSTGEVPAGGYLIATIAADAAAIQIQGSGVVSVDQYVRDA